MEIHLVAQAGPNRGQAVAVRAEKFFIGSDAHCQLRPDIPGLGKIHTLIERRGVQVLARDLGTEAGTQLNGVALPAKAVEVFDGDVLTIGPMDLKLAIRPRAEDLGPALEAAPLGWPYAVPEEDLEPAPRPAPKVQQEEPELLFNPPPAYSAPSAPPPPRATPVAPAAAAPPVTSRPAEGEVPPIAHEALDFEVQGEVLVVTLKPADLNDESTVGPLRYELQCLLDRPLPRREVIDLAPITFLSSRAVGVLLAHYQHLDRQGGTLRVCCAHARVLPVLDQMRLSQVIDVYPTREEALADPWE